MRIYGDDFEGQIFIHSMNFLLLKDIYGVDLGGVDLGLEMDKLVEKINEIKRGFMSVFDIVFSWRVKHSSTPHNEFLLLKDIW